MAATFTLEAFISTYLHAALWKVMGTYLRIWTIDYICIHIPESRSSFFLPVTRMNLHHFHSFITASIVLLSVTRHAWLECEEPWMSFLPAHSAWVCVWTVLHYLSRHLVSKDTRERKRLLRLDHVQVCVAHTAGWYGGRETKREKEWLMRI